MERGIREREISLGCFSEQHFTGDFVHQLTILNGQTISALVLCKVCRSVSFIPWRTQKSAAGSLGVYRETCSAVSSHCSSGYSKPSLPVTNSSQGAGSQKYLDVNPPPPTPSDFRIRASVISVHTPTKRLTSDHQLRGTASSG